MTPEELVTEIQKLHAREEVVRRKIVEHARSLVPVLKDAGREHSAKELDRLVYENDAIQEEIQKLVIENALLFIEMLAGGPRRP